MEELQKLTFVTKVHTRSYTFNRFQTAALAVELFHHNLTWTFAISQLLLPSLVRINDLNTLALAPLNVMKATAHFPTAIRHPQGACQCCEMVPVYDESIALSVKECVVYADADHECWVKNLARLIAS